MSTTIEWVKCVASRSYTKLYEHHNGPNRCFSDDDDVNHNNATSNLIAIEVEKSEQPMQSSSSLPTATMAGRKVDSEGGTLYLN